VTTNHGELARDVADVKTFRKRHGMVVVEDKKVVVVGAKR
jgi:hypothetical protein